MRPDKSVSQLHICCQQPHHSPNCHSMRQQLHNMHNFFTFHTGSRTYNRSSRSRPVVALTHRCPAYTCTKPLITHLVVMQFLCQVYLQSLHAHTSHLSRGGNFCRTITSSGRVIFSRTSVPVIISLPSRNHARLSISQTVGEIAQQQSSLRKPTVC